MKIGIIDIVSIQMQPLKTTVYKTIGCPIHMGTIFASTSSVELSLGDVSGFPLLG